jgi:hypothetical protein
MMKRIKGVNIKIPIPMAKRAITESGRKGRNTMKK